MQGLCSPSREAFGYCAEIGTDSEDLLKQEDPGAGASFGHPDMTVELVAARCGNVLNTG